MSERWSADYWPEESWDDYMTRKHGHPEWASDPDDDAPRDAWSSDDAPENTDDTYR